MHQPTAKYLAADLGGSLIKMVYFSPDQGGASSMLGGRLHFKKVRWRDYRTRTHEQAFLVIGSEV